MLYDELEGWDLGGREALEGLDQFTSVQSLSHV